MTSTVRPDAAKRDLAGVTQTQTAISEDVSEDRGRLRDRSTSVCRTGRANHSRRLKRHIYCLTVGKIALLLKCYHDFMILPLHDVICSCYKPVGLNSSDSDVGGIRNSDSVSSRLVQLVKLSV